MLGVFREGDKLTAIVGPYDSNTGGVYTRVGQDDVTSIVVGKADGPMGFYAVAQVMRGSDGVITETHPIHMLETVVIEDHPKGDPS